MGILLKVRKVLKYNHLLYSRKKIFEYKVSPDITLQLNCYFNILPFKKLAFHRLGLQLYKYEFGIISIPLRSLFSKNCSVHNYNTRNSNKLRLALSRHAYGDKEFRFIYVHVWNYICHNVSIHVFFPSQMFHSI